ASPAPSALARWSCPVRRPDHDRSACAPGGCPWQGSAHEVSRRALRFRRKLLEHRDPGWGVGGLAVDGDQVADLVDHPPYRGRGVRLDGVIELAKPQRREGRLLIPGIADRTLAIRHPNGAHVSTTS